VQTSPTRYALFRPASVQARASAWQGRPSLILASSSTYTTFAAAALAAAFFALIAFGSYARRIDMHGTLLPSSGLISVSAPAAGSIESLEAKEGDVVVRGTPLYALNVDTATKRGEVQQLVAGVLHSEHQVYSGQIDRITAIAKQTESYLKQKIDNLSAQVQQIDIQIATSTGFHKTLDDEYRFYLEMLKSRLVQRNDFDARQQTWMRSKTELQTLENNKLRLIGDLHDAEYKLATLETDTDNQIDALRTKISEIDEKLAADEARGTIVIRAPGAGVVTDIVGKPGQVVKIGSPMLTILPEAANMQAVLLAPSTAIGFVHVGQRVLLRYSAFPYQKFGEQPGTIVSIAGAALDGDEAKAAAGREPAEEKNGPYYRIIVAPDRQFIDAADERHSLPANMRVDAYALLDRRPLYQWILQPVYAFGRALHEG